MTIGNINEAFQQCEYPFFKDVLLKNQEAQCVVYSVHTSFQSTLSLSLLNYESLLHTISLEMIRLRSKELLAQQEDIISKAI